MKITEITLINGRVQRLGTLQGDSGLLREILTPFLKAQERLKRSYIYEVVGEFKENYIGYKYYLKPEELAIVKKEIPDIEE